MESAPASLARAIRSVSLPCRASLSARRITSFESLPASFSFSLAQDLHVGEFLVVEQLVLAQRQGHLVPFRPLRVGLGQIHLIAGSDIIGVDHEDDDEHQAHVHQRRDVDVGDRRVVGNSAAGHA